MHKPGMRYAASSMADFLTKQIDALKGIKSQRQIAAEIGYDKPNMISMFKRGESKVPIEKIVPLALAIEADPKHLLRLHFEQIDRELGKIVYELINLGDTFGLSDQEVDLVIFHRKMSNNMDPVIGAKFRTELKKVYDM